MEFPAILIVLTLFLIHNIEGSIKDSERERGCKCSTIDLNELLTETPLPVNKTKVQE